MQLVLLELEVLHLLKVYLLSSFEVLVHPIFSRDVAKHLETFGDELCMQPVVWV